MSDFYPLSEKIREKIRERSLELLSKIKENRVRDILMQRARFSSFIKGILAYYIHDGLNGNFSNRRKIDLSSKLEVFSSSGAILDNVIDGHEERNGKTTYLKVWINYSIICITVCPKDLASDYSQKALHQLNLL